MEYIFFPSASFARSQQSTPRFYFGLDGVLANFTTQAASYLDDLQLPYPASGCFEESMLKKHFVSEVLFDICNGQQFWESVPMYDWSWNLFECAYILSNGNVYFGSRAYKEDSESWAGKAAWVHKHFGQYGVDRLILSLHAKNLVMVCNGKMDILVACDKANIDMWNAAGGTGLYFPELDIRWTGCAQEVANRLNAMKECVSKLRQSKSG